LIELVSKEFLKVTLQLVMWTFFDVLTVIPPMLMHRKSFGAIQKVPVEQVNKSDELLDGDNERGVDGEYEFAEVIRET
jgi:hypothetical protein